MFKSLASLRGFYHKRSKLRDGLTENPGETNQPLKSMCSFKSAADFSKVSRGVRISPLEEKQN